MGACCPCFKKPGSGKQKQTKVVKYTKEISEKISEKSGRDVKSASIKSQSIKSISKSVPYENVQKTVQNIIDDKEREKEKKTEEKTYDKLTSSLQSKSQLIIPPKLTVEYVTQIKDEVHKGQEGDGVHPDTVDIMILMLNRLAEEGIPRRRSKSSVREPTHPKPIVLQKLALALSEGKTAEGIDQNDLEAALYIFELAVGLGRPPKPIPKNYRAPPPPLKIAPPSKLRSVEQHDENYITVPRNRLMPEEQATPPSKLLGKKF